MSQTFSIQMSFQLDRTSEHQLPANDRDQLAESIVVV